MRLWELCSGSGSVGLPWRETGHEVLSLDIDPKTGADVIADLLTWDYKQGPGPDVIWCSPPCTHYSRARSKAKTPRDLEGSDRLVQRCLDIIAYWKPKAFFIENPQTGLLKNRPVVQGLPFVDLDYCQYRILGQCVSYRKRTRIWTNVPWIPRPLCTCRPHLQSAQKGHSRLGTGKTVNDNYSTEELYALPEALCREILEVANAHASRETEEEEGESSGGS